MTALLEMAVLFAGNSKKIKSTVSENSLHKAEARCDWSDASSSKGGLWGSCLLIVLYMFYYIL
jgi:hypothetical protein